LERNEQLVAEEDVNQAEQRGYTISSELRTTKKNLSGNNFESNSTADHRNE
jgi:hypothetical protein